MDITELIEKLEKDIERKKLQHEQTRNELSAARDETDRYKRALDEALAEVIRLETKVRALGMVDIKKVCAAIERAELYGGPEPDTAVLDIEDYNLIRLAFTELPGETIKANE